MAKRLIDADALIEWFRPYAHTDERIDFDTLKEDIDGQPTVDATEVVRCRDCKHYQHYGRTSLLINGKNIKCGWCQRRIRYDEEYRMLPNDFCSYGERWQIKCVKCASGRIVKDTDKEVRRARGEAK